jgi:hypothetical protein
VRDEVTKTCLILKNSADKTATYNVQCNKLVSGYKWKSTHKTIGRLYAFRRTRWAFHIIYKYSETENFVGRKLLFTELLISLGMPSTARLMVSTQMDPSLVSHFSPRRNFTVLVRINLKQRWLTRNDKNLTP